MNLGLTSVIFDAADLESESAFWHHLLGGSLTETPTHSFIQAVGLSVIVVQGAPAQEPPSWPAGHSQQMHMDLGSDDLAEADKRVLDAGGVA
ncbi:MAG: VOC family protein [Pseudonocardia sp.]|nr:VOC family protein [Pseudonocardia sp.]